MIFLWLALGCGEAAPPHQPSGLELYPQCADLSDCQGKYAQAIADKNDVFAGLYAYDACNYGDEDLCLVYVANAAGPITKGGILDELCRKYPRKLCVAAGDFRAESGAYDLAVEYYKVGCDAGYLPACDAAAQLAIDYWDFKDAALASASKGCAAGSDASCKSLGRWNSSDKEWSLARLPVFEAGCSANSLHGCVGAGSVYYFYTDPPDPARAKTLFERACTGGAALGCSDIALMYARDAPDKIPEANDLAKKACDAGDGLGCRLVVIFAVDGMIPNPDFAYAVTAGKRACELNEWVACESLAEGIDSGKLPGTPADAAAFRKTACDGGRQASCRP